MSIQTVLSGWLGSLALSRRHPHHTSLLAVPASCSCFFIKHQNIKNSNYKQESHIAVPMPFPVISIHLVSFRVTHRNDIEMIQMIQIQKFARSLQDIVTETILGGENSVQGPLLLTLLFVGLDTMSPSVTAKHHTHCYIHCVPFKISIICWCHFSIR